MEVTPLRPALLDSYCLDHEIRLQVVLLELFRDAAGFNYRAGWRWKMTIVELAVHVASPTLRSVLVLAGDSSLPYIGSRLGFWVTGKLQVYPYDITTVRGRLELAHHYSTGGIVHQWRLCDAGPPVWIGGWVGPVAPSRTWVPSSRIIESALSRPA